MAFSLDNILGIHEPALHLQSKRASVLASNLANADTPGYKARDINFQDALKQAANKNSANRLRATHTNHIQPANDFYGAELQYRVPTQDAIDGNTVETHIEIGKYAENSMQYMASLRFIKSKFSGVMSALRGE